jgi:hypothetical protein
MAILISKKSLSNRRKSIALLDIVGLFEDVEDWSRTRLQNKSKVLKISAIRAKFSTGFSSFYTRQLKGLQFYHKSHKLLLITQNV